MGRTCPDGGPCPGTEGEAHVVPRARRRRAAGPPPPLRTGSAVHETVIIIVSRVRDGSGADMVVRTRVFVICTSAYYTWLYVSY